MYRYLTDNEPAANRIALILENPALAKVKPITSHSTNESADANNNDLFSWRHGFMFLLSFNIGFFGVILLRRMTPNKESAAVLRTITLFFIDIEPAL